MNCQEARELLPRSIDRQLAGDEQALLCTHLDGCADCAADQAGHARVDALLGAALADHPFGDLAVERILEALPAAPAAQQAWTPQRLGGAVAAAAAVLLGVTLMLGDGSPDPRVDVQTAQAVAQVQAEGWLRLGEVDEELTAAAEVHAGDRLVALTTPAVLTLPDGTRVDVHADTELTFRQDADGGLAVVMASDGRLFCEVAKREAPFRVVTRDLTVEVLGTQFAVDQEVRVSRVVVVEGRVEASSGTDRRVLTADQGAELRDGLAKLEPLQVTARDRVGWLPRVREGGAAEPAPQPTARPTARPASPAPSATARPSPTDPSLDTPILPPGRDELPGND